MCQDFCEKSGYVSRSDLEAQPPFRIERISFGDRKLKYFEAAFPALMLWIFYLMGCIRTTIMTASELEQGTERLLAIGVKPPEVILSRALAQCCVMLCHMDMLIALEIVVFVNSAETQILVLLLFFLQGLQAYIPGWMSWLGHENTEILVSLCVFIGAVTDGTYETQSPLCEVEDFLSGRARSAGLWATIRMRGPAAAVASFIKWFGYILYPKSLL